MYTMAAAAFILFPLGAQKNLLAAGSVATPIKSSNIQIAQWNVNYALCASTRTKSDSRTHTLTLTQLHSFIRPSLSLFCFLADSTNSIIIICNDQFARIISINTDTTTQNFKWESTSQKGHAWRGRGQWAVHPTMLIRNHLIDPLRETHAAQTNRGTHGYTPTQIHTHTYTHTHTNTHCCYLHNRHFITINLIYILYKCGAIEVPNVKRVKRSLCVCVPCFSLSLYVCMCVCVLCLLICLHVSMCVRAFLCVCAAKLVVSRRALIRVLPARMWYKPNCQIPCKIVRQFLVPQSVLN